MNEQELATFLEKHSLYLTGEEGGEIANLSGANLSGANLSYANLSYAYLRDANLSYANLSGANLWGCAGNSNEIKSIFVSEIYMITYTFEYLHIGCEKHLISDWWGFDDEKIISMDGEQALKFWAEWKDTIRTLIEKAPAKSTGNEDKPEQKDSLMAKK